LSARGRRRRAAGKVLRAAARVLGWAIVARAAARHAA